MTKRHTTAVRRLFTAGIALSAICLFIGLALTIAARASSADGGVPHPLLHVGLIVLIATPILRVIVALVEDVWQRQWFFALATLVVLAVLAGTLFVAWQSLP